MGKATSKIMLQKYFIFPPVFIENLGYPGITVRNRKIVILYTCDVFIKIALIVFFTTLWIILKSTINILVSRYSDVFIVPTLFLFSNFFYHKILRFVQQTNNCFPSHFSFDCYYNLQVQYFPYRF